MFHILHFEEWHLIDPQDAHDKAYAIAHLKMTLYGLHRSFATLSKWVKMPGGIAAQM
jgi:hypothetical protein